MTPIEENEDVIVITPLGPEICAEPREGLEEMKADFLAAEQRNPKVVILDLAKVQYVDSIGLGAIVTEKLKLPEGCQFHLCNLGDKLDAIIQVSGLKKFILIEDSLEEAIEAARRNREDNSPTGF
jgi:anti-anti-sigma factor